MKHHCIFEITQPNIHSELYKASFVDDYGEDYTAADEMCQSMNNFKPKDKFVHFILRCLEQEEFDAVQDFLKTNPHGDVSEVYSPFTQKIVITETTEDYIMTKNDRLLFYVMQGDKKLKASPYLVGAQLARECMIDAGEGDASM